MNDKQKRKLKIRLKAGVTLALDSIILYNVFGTLGVVKTVGLKNAIKEFNSTAHEFILETGNDQLIEKANSLVTTLKLDMSNLNDSKDMISNCPCLKYVEIHNAQRIDDEMFELLNNQGLEEIHLIFNKQEVLKQVSTKQKFDLNRFNNKSIIKSVRFSSNEDNIELDSFIFLNYLYNYDDCNLEFIKYKYLDSIIEDIAAYLDLNYNYPEDMMNLIKIVNVEREYLKYDEEIYNYSHTVDMESNADKDKTLYNKIEHYNKESLSSILDLDKAELADHKRQINGICSNYQAFFTALCIKANIECYPICGTYTDTEHSAPHSWNLIQLYDEYFLVDVTRFDSFEECNKLMDKYLQTFDPEDYKKLIYSVIYPLDSEIVSEYSSREVSIDSIKEGLLVEPVDSKNKIYGTNVNKDIYNKYGKICLLTIFAVGIGYVLYKERKRWLYTDSKDNEKSK